jgi:hypothetical protein
MASEASHKSNSNEKKEVSFEQVEIIMSRMISKGLTPHIRDVREEARCSQATAIKLFNEVKEKHRKEAAKVADEFGSGEVAKLIAAELNNMVITKTTKLHEANEDLRLQVEELTNEFMQHEKDCVARITEAESLAENQVAEAEERAQKAIQKAENAESEKVEAIVKAKDDVAVAKSEAEQATKEANERVNASEHEAKTLINAAKSEAEKLVQSAERRLEAAEKESAQLRQKVQELTISEAKHALEKEQFEQQKATIIDLQEKLADAKTTNVRVSTQNESVDKDNARLLKELDIVKGQLEKASDAQGMLVETQKQLGQIQNALGLAERERDSAQRSLTISEADNNRMSKELEASLKEIDRLRVAKKKTDN